MPFTHSLFHHLLLLRGAAAFSSGSNSGESVLKFFFIFIFIICAFVICDPDTSYLFWWGVHGVFSGLASHAAVYPWLAGVIVIDGGLVKSSKTGFAGAFLFIRGIISVIETSHSSHWCLQTIFSLAILVSVFWLVVILLNCGRASGI